MLNIQHQFPHLQPSVPSPHLSGSSAATAEDSEPSRRGGGGGSQCLHTIRHLAGHVRRNQSVASVAFREDKGIAASAATTTVFICSSSLP